jgi:hypothetical protein
MINAPLDIQLGGLFCQQQGGVVLPMFPNLLSHVIL